MNTRLALKLDSNEGPLPPPALLAALASLDLEALRRYPDVSTLEATLASRVGVAPNRVIVTAGADDAIDRVCRAYLGAGRTMLLAEPTFEMFDHFAKLSGAATLVRVPWPCGEFPLAAFLDRLEEQPAVIAVVSPNNPTGATATAADVRRLAEAAPGALVLLDHVYVEYADEDVTPAVIDLPNVVVLRTLSKAWGLAGCRIGYAIASPDVIATLRISGAPYPVAAPSVAVALRQLADGDEALRVHVACVREERSALCARLTALGLEPLPSQSNFILAECGELAPFLTAALAALGVFVRAFPNRPGLTSALRITLPGNAAAFERLVAAFETALAPEALLFDLDGVLADVQHSQRAAIAATAGAFGVAVTSTQVAAAIRTGDAANDWLVTRRLIEAGGCSASFDDVTERYQSLYLSLREQERLIPPSSLLDRLAAGRPLALVTGRPRAEAQWFLDRAGVASLFGTVVAMEDARPKPDPAPVRLALERLGVRRAWMIGDTPDDVRGAAQAGVLPLGVVAPGDDASLAGAALRDAGAARVLDRLSDLLELLP
ncbi:MAG: aminotransferase class I/II-fold pyridoxal phosphate-dependent enzyme [Gemmatimonadales bacterium]